MLDVAISWTAELLPQVAADPSQSPTPELIMPSPGEGETPPGFTHFNTLLGWMLWASLGACVGGLMLIGARMGINHKRGEAGGHMGSIGIVGIGVILVVGAPAIVLKIATSG